MKILDQLVMACRTMNFAPATESCSLSWVDVSTTMIYTHVANKGSCGVLSPLDRL